MSFTETPQGQDAQAPGPSILDLDAPHGSPTASAVEHSPSHDLDIEPTVVASSAIDQAGFQPSIPDAVEIIDVDELPDLPDTLSTIKQEPDIKPEPGIDGLSWAAVPFMTWRNTSADPIVIDEDDGAHDAQIPKGRIAGAGFQERLRSAQQTFFKSLRSQPKATEAPHPLDPPPTVTFTDEFGIDEMDIDTSDDEAKTSWEE